MKNVILTGFLLTLVLGCGLRPGREETPKTIWMSSRYSSAEAAWVYLNFYSEFESFSRYSGYGIVSYTRNISRDAKLSESELLEDSLRLCRQEYKDAYVGKTLLRWDSDKNGTVPYSPNYIAVVMSNYIGTNDHVGIIVSAEELFSNKPIKDLVLEAKVSRGKIWFQDITEEEKQKGFIPGTVIRYTHIEEHMESIKSQSILMD